MGKGLVDCLTSAKVMKYDKYSIEGSDSSIEFEFYSEGPKGKVKKKITFVTFEDDPEVYNLTFGDVIADEQIDDLAITDNGDGRKVLATVVSAVYRFFERHPDFFVQIEGSTKSRIRLYRMVIANNLTELSENFLIYGLYKEDWEEFRKNRDYEAFLIATKI